MLSNYLQLDGGIATLLVGRYSTTMAETQRDRVKIIQECLKEDIMPRLLDLPAQRSDKARDALRVSVNYLSTLIEGNDKFLKDQVNHG